MTGFTPHSVLCVESSDDVRRSLQALLRAYDCVFAADAFEAVNRVNMCPCDAYVLDYWMPDWSGPLLCREIRKQDPHSPIIFCGLSRSHEDRAFRAGASAYLVKPLDERALTSKLQTLVARSDFDNLRAGRESDRVLCGEIQSVASLLRTRTLATPESGACISETIERMVRSRALRAHIDGGGTRAHFERSWARVFVDALARHERAAAA